MSTVPLAGRVEQVTVIPNKCPQGLLGAWHDTHQEAVSLVRVCWPTKVSTEVGSRGIPQNGTKQQVSNVVAGSFATGWATSGLAPAPLRGC
eukprot:7115105-Alexandrium_andersonii.AAC.1